MNGRARPADGGADGSAEPITEDTLFGGLVRLRQLRRGHRAGTDAVLLAAAVQAQPGETVYDFGAATGAVGLMIAARCPGATLVFVEADPVLAKLCEENIRLNGLAERARVVAADLLAPASERRAAGLAAAGADLVATNPPFFEEAEGRRSPDRRRAAAHALPAGGLKRWLGAASDALKAKGRLALIHRADRLDACLAALGRGFGSIAIRPVYPRAGEPAIRIIVTAAKGGRAPLAILPGIALHGADGRFTREAEALHAGARTLS